MKTKAAIRLIASVLIIGFTVAAPSGAMGQTSCDEPDDQAYSDGIVEVGQAIEAEDFEAALVHLE